MRDPVRAAHRGPVGVPAAGAELRLGHDVLAPTAGLELGWGLAAAARGPARRTRRGFTPGLVKMHGGLFARQGAKKGLATGPTPVDRGRPGSKHHLISDPRQAVRRFC